MECKDRRVWAIRGAITVTEDSPDKIDEAVGELLTTIYKENSLDEGEVVFTLFSQTPDLKSKNAAASSRKNGFSTRSPLFCVQEADINGMLPFTIRVMIEIERECSEGLKMIYLRDAAKLRPDYNRK